MTSFQKRYQENISPYLQRKESQYASKDSDSIVLSQKRT